MAPGALLLTMPVTQEAKGGVEQGPQQKPGRDLPVIFFLKLCTRLK